MKMAIMIRLISGKGLIEKKKIGKEEIYFEKTV
jgi:hypothetical protein